MRNHINSLPHGTKVPVDKAVKLLSAAFYPWVRKVLEWDGKDYYPMHAIYLNHYMMDILLADFARTSLSPLKKDSTVALNSIPKEIPVVCFGDGTAQPLVHFSVFEVLSLPIMRERYLPPPLYSIFRIDEQLGNEVAFEERMFRVFGLFMSIFCDPRAPTDAFRRIVHRVINEWLPDGAWKLEGRCDSFLKESKSHYLPFATHTNHEDACNGPIFEDVLSRILKLKKGCAWWVRFGGEASVDYMLFVRREGNRMEVRFGDAKHHKDDLPSQQRDVVAKAELVHAGLKRELGKHGLSLEKFDKSHVLLFTNVPTEEAVSPNTFCWSPWRRFLFQDDDAAGTVTAQSGR